MLGLQRKCCRKLSKPHPLSKSRRKLFQQILLVFSDKTDYWCRLGRVIASYNKTGTVLVPKITTKDFVCVSIESIR